MNVKKIFSFFLAVMLLAGLLAGCGSTPNTNSKAYEKIHSILKDSEFYFLDETGALAPYYEMAAERKEAILNSPTEIVKSDEFIPGETYTGTAYYVSPNGNNDNDGLSPETAWQTVDRTGWGDVQEGDAVFFERGGIYRLTEHSLDAVSNVTYSAYGEGAKPIITLAQENSARSECWELYYEGKNGEKIWRYYQPVGETGGIVFDDTSYAKRIYEWPTPEGWLALDIQVMDPANGIVASEDPCGKYQVASANEYRTVEEQLTSDLTYICRVDITGLSYPVDFGQEHRTGDLYLRCDEGNPGECFEEIAVISQQKTDYGECFGSIVHGSQANGWVLDNLSLKYYLDQAVFGFVSTGKNAVIQNCTVEWGGNRLHQIPSVDPTNNYMLIGDGIYCVANNAIIRNNYIRHGGNGCTFEDPWEENVGHLGTYTADGNLIENCGQGIRTYFCNSENKELFDALILRDNIILNTGNSINNACWEEPVAIDVGYDSLQYAKHIEVSNNIMIGSTLAMVRMPDSSNVEIDFHDNVIAQSRDGALITECAWTAAGRPIWHMMADAKE